jgi:hypothetical protein
LTFQKQPAVNWIFTLSYIGNHTPHVWLSRESNPAVYIPGASITSNTNRRRPLDGIRRPRVRFKGTEAMGVPGQLFIGFVLVAIAFALGPFLRPAFFSNSQMPFCCPASLIVQSHPFPKRQLALRRQTSPLARPS